MNIYNGISEEYIVKNDLGKSKTNFACNIGLGAMVDVAKNLNVDYKWADYSPASTCSTYPNRTKMQNCEGINI